MCSKPLTKEECEKVNRAMWEDRSDENVDDEPHGCYISDHKVKFNRGIDGTACTDQIPCICSKGNLL